MFDCVKVSRMESMLVVEADHMEARSPVEAQRRIKITSYAIMLIIMYGGTLSIQQRGPMSKLQKLSGMDRRLR